VSDLVYLIVMVIVFAVFFYLITRVIHWPVWLPAWLPLAVWCIVLIYWLLGLVGVVPSLHINR